MYFENNPEGWLEVICGPMFAGKSEELLRRINRLEYAKINYLLFKPKVDNRYSKNHVVTHNGDLKKAIVIESSDEIKDYLKEGIKVIAIDEVHFLEENVVEVIDKLCDKGYRIVVTGLDLDYRSEPFIVTSKLLSKAEFVTKLKAICKKCGSLATRTCRTSKKEDTIINNDPIFLIGSDDIYESRCRICYNSEK